MSRTIFVALCAVALFAMAPFALADDKTEFVPPKNPVTDLYRAMTPNTMLAADMTAEELSALAEKCSAQRDPHVTVKICNDGIHEYWEYMWNARGKEDECHVELTVTLVKDKVTGTMYLARKGGDYPTETAAGERPPTEPKNPCHDMYNEVVIGMPKDDFLKLAAKHGFDKSKICKTDKGEEQWGCVWWKYHQNDPAPPPPNAWQWQIVVDVEFSEGRVAKAEYIPLAYRPAEKK